MPHRSLLLVALLVPAAPVLAMDKFEIQVYQGEHNAPGQLSLELHHNYTVVGHTEPGYPGEVPAAQALRLTLEPAFGVTDWLELGAYLQGFHSPRSGPQFGGWKLRAKFVVPERARLPLRLGLNIEVGRVPLSVEEEGWANEFRPILGIDVGRLQATLNPIFGYALTGPDAFKPDFEPAAKVKFDTQQWLAVGLEYYASLGRFDQGFLSLPEQEHILFAVFDLEPPPGAAESPWEVNVGLGRSLTTATPQQWLLKGIVGRSF